MRSETSSPFSRYFHLRYGGALVAALAAFACGGGQSGDLNQDALSKNTGQDDRGDAGVVSPNGGVVPADLPPEGLELGNVELPTRSWRAAFQSGFDAKEELWLLPADSDVPVNVTPDGKPDADWHWGTLSSAGYMDNEARIGAVLFDAARQRLFSTWVVGEAYELRSLNLETGSWRLWTRTPTRPELSVSEFGVAMRWREEEKTHLLAEVEGRLETVPFAGESSPRFQRYGAGKNDRLLVGNAVLQREDGEWTPLDLDADLPKGDWSLAPSPTGSHTCVYGNGEAWLVSDDGSVDLEITGQVHSCRFTPEGDYLFFENGSPQFEATTLVADTSGHVVFADYPYLSLEGAAHLEGVSYAGSGLDLVQIDWEKLEVSSLWQFEADDELVSNRSIPSVWDLGQTLLVQRYHGCIDCDISTYYLVNPKGSEASELFPRQEWMFFSLAILPEGGALVTRSGEDADRIFVLDAQGKVTELGPFHDNAEPLHGLIGLQ